MSGEIWLPQWNRVDLGGPNGDPYVDGQNVKLLWHSWEGTNWQAAEDAFRAYPPHTAAKIFDEVRQYVPLDEHAYALYSTASETEFVIQVEVAGFAGQMRDLPYEALEWLAKNVLEPILFFHDVPDLHPLFYDDKDGITLASKYSPIRMNRSDWNAYSGHVGHQHAPNPDEHWDPGRLDVDTIIRIARKNQHEILNPMPKMEMQTMQDIDKNGDIWFVGRGTTDEAFVTRCPAGKDSHVQENWDEPIDLQGTFLGGLSILCSPDGWIRVSGIGITGKIYTKARNVNGEWDKDWAQDVPGLWK